MLNKNELPSLILLSNFNGIFTDYYEAVYEIFREDFVTNKPLFNGKKLALKTHPYVDHKEYTFYHSTHSGDIEKERIPDLRRMERIGWAKPTIENYSKWKLKIWPQIRKGKNRICIWLELKDDLDYIVILEDRKKYVLPWATFVLKYNHEKRKKQKEYEDYLKARTA